MPYAWKIEYNSVDISDKVSSFVVTASLESYCREMTLDIADLSFYTGLDFTQIPEDTEIEIFTKIADTWISQGSFFIERPALDTSIHADLVQGIWGRSTTARLTEPFAPKVSKLWDDKTTFFSICDEMCELAGLIWDSAYSDIDDYLIYQHTYAAESVYPVDVITELAMLAGALVTTDRAGHVCIKRIDYVPDTADETLTDSVIREIIETPEMPEFANRVRITPTGALAGYSLDLIVPDICLPADGNTRTKLFAQVFDSDGIPIDGIPVAWSNNASSASLIEGVSNTQEIYVQREEHRASDYYTVKTDFPPGAVGGIWAYGDLARKTNLALAGYSIAGNTITLTERLAYCDQALIVAYRTDGIAINYLQAGSISEDVIITVDVEGEIANETVYIDNPCQCPPSITLAAHPSNLHVGETSALLAYLEEGGPVISGRTIYMSEGSAEKRGRLSWNAARFGVASVSNQKSIAINEISGVTQCELAMFPASVISVYQTDANGLATGSNLYASHSSKVVNLTTILSSGTELVVNYRVQGAALNHFTAESLGSAKINAYIRTNREAVVKADVLIKIVDETSSVDDFPEDWGYDSDSINWGNPGGDEEEFDPEEELETEPLCIPGNVGSNVTEHALARRFGSALGEGCSCDELCQNEFNIFGTNQGNDDGSYRTISDLAEESSGFPPGTPEHSEAYGPLQEQSLADCLEECEGCEGVDPLTWSASNPETIDSPGEVAISVSGGKGPFFWTLGTFEFSLGKDGQTLTRGNTLSAEDSACGSATITVSDSCGGEVTGYVRSTAGKWCLIEQCSLHSVHHYSFEKRFAEVHEKYKYTAVFCVASCDGTCLSHCDHGSCDTPIAPPDGTCCCFSTVKYEWKCEC